MYFVTPVRLHGFNRTTFSPCCLGLGPILLYVLALHVHRYDLLLASALTSHATKCGDQCLICYWTHQHVVSYKVTKLAVPLKMATIADVRESISSLPDEPHHPKRFAFLKRSFGKTKPVFCSAKNKWFDT